MASEQLKPYPSGFLGSILVPQTQPTNVLNRARSLFSSFSPIDFPKVSHYTANETVTELWMDQVRNTKERLSWEENEEIIKAAVNAFGCNSFIDWVITQGKSPDYTAHHHNWINETILYLYANQPRALSESNWRDLLIPGGLRHPPEPRSAEVRHFLLQDAMTKYGTYQGQLPDTTVKGVVRTWISKPGGIIDLMASLNVLFGPR